MRYEGDIYRPPGEWRSYLLQCTVGCSYNGCTYCGMYKNKRYHVRPLADILEDIDMAREAYTDFSSFPLGIPNVSRVFLCDGDAIVLPMQYLLAVLERLREAFPRLRRVTCYAGPLSTMTKTHDELCALREAGLTRAYLGVESGDTELLERVKKGVDASGMLEAGLALRGAGFDLWVTVIAGLEGGGDAYIRNAALTAELLNRMAPEHLSVMTYMPMLGTPMYDDILAGHFRLQSPRESLLETRELLSRLKLEKTHFTANHHSNLLPLNGTISADTGRFIRLLDEAAKFAPDVASRRAYEHG